MDATTNQRRWIGVVVLLAAGLLVAGCGSQQASPLSLAKTEHVFATAGIRLRAPGIADEVITPDLPTGISHPPVALIWAPAHPHWFSFVLVFRDVAGAVRARQRPTNPSYTVTRMGNVLIYVARQEQRDPRLRAAMRRL